MKTVGEDTLEISLCSDIRKDWKLQDKILCSEDLKGNKKAVWERPAQDTLLLPRFGTYKETHRNSGSFCLEETTKIIQSNS